MSKYTTQLRWIVESFANDETLSLREKIDKSLPKIFDFDYPIWSENYRRELERKIIKHYFNKEIGLETFGLWQFYLDERLNLIMPYYNDLYKTTIEKYDWLENIDIKENFDSEKTTESTSKNNSKTNQLVKDNQTNNITTDGRLKNTSNNTAKNLSSDLPQSNFAGLDFGTNLMDTESNGIVEDIQTTDTENKMTGNTISDIANDSTNENNSKNKDKYNKVIKGLNGSHTKTQLTEEYRKSLINIDKLIINELKDLFMMIY